MSGNIDIVSLATFISAFGACASAFATFRSVSEMKKQREVMYQPDPVVPPVKIEGNVDLPATSARETGRVINIGTGVAKDVSIRFSNNIRELVPEASIQLASMNNGYLISYEDSGLNIQQTSSSSSWGHTIQGSQGLKAACIFQGEENRIIFRLPSDFVAMAIFLAAMNTQEMNHILSRLQLTIDMEFSDILGIIHKKQQVLRFSSSTYQASDGSFILRFM